MSAKSSTALAAGAILTPRLAREELPDDGNERLDALLERPDDGDAEPAAQPLLLGAQRLGPHAFAVQRHGERARAERADQRDLVGDRRDPQAELLEPLVVASARARAGG